MQPTTYRTSIVALGLTALCVAPIGQAWATTDFPVCYKVVDQNDNKAHGPGYYSPERLVLDVSFHSYLKTTRSNGRQTVYDADGKHTYWEGGSGHNSGDDHTVMAVFDGAIVTSNYSWKQPRGSHLGGTSYFVRDPNEHGYGPEGGPYYSPIHWECTSRQVHATPDTWSCTIAYQTFGSNNSNSGSYEYRGVYLKRVKHNRDEKCDIFQDTADYFPDHNYNE